MIDNVFVFVVLLCFETESLVPQAGFTFTR